LLSLQQLGPVIIPLLLVSACGPGVRTFRFTGTYKAPLSGYRIHLISQGYVLAGDDLSQNGFAWVRVCPLPGMKARPLKLSLTATPNSWTLIESPEQGLMPTELKSNDTTPLSALLEQAGYQTLNPSETAGSVRVMESALTGPKGVILEGQIDTVQVLETQIDYGYRFDLKQSPQAWINPEDLEVCDSLKK